jgi:glycosyltransferase involved in cell wall biosynthesis
MARRRILQVFNRYLFMGGEEKSVDRIYDHLGREHEMARCFYDSREWTGAGAPSKLSQLRRTFYNVESCARFAKAVADFKPDSVLFHNIYPVGSPSLYHAALQLGVPVIQYVHNFRPLSVGGTLYVNGQLTPESLKGNYWREIKGGAWQGSVLKSAIFALLLKRLHRSGWLRSVKAWVCISDFIRERFIEAGLEPSEVHSLRHSWDAMPLPPDARDEGYHLFLGRLVEQKGIRTLLDAWHKLETELGTKTPKLRIAGEGPLEGVVRDAAARSANISYLGVIDGVKKREEIANCRTMLAPSTWWEPLGLVAYEAYDSAKPMLAAASGGLSETVIQGVTGLLHAPGNAEALARDIMTVESMTAERRAAIGAAGRSWLLQNTRREDWLQRFDSILDSVVR